MHTFEVQVEPKMMRQAWNAWFLNQSGRWRLAVAVLLVIAPIVLKMRSGRLDTLSIILLTVLGVAALVFVGAYFVGLRRALAKHASIVEGKAGYTLSDSTIEAASSLGSLTLAWPAVTEVRRYQDLILLRFLGTTYSTIPESQIPPDALAFLVERARHGGATITGI
jgi:hypothetical protein